MIRAREQEIGHRSNRDTKSGVEVGYEKILESGKVWEGDRPGSQLSERSVGELMKELRWANLGWVYRVSLPQLHSLEYGLTESGRLRVMISILQPLYHFHKV